MIFSHDECFNRKFIFRNSYCDMKPLCLSFIQFKTTTLRKRMTKLPQDTSLREADVQQRLECLMKVQDHFAQDKDGREHSHESRMSWICRSHTYIKPRSCYFMQEESRGLLVLLVDDIKFDPQVFLLPSRYQDGSFAKDRTVSPINMAST
jgi:hypothetical protein